MWIVRPNKSAFNLNLCDLIWIEEKKDLFYLVCECRDEKYTQRIPFDTNELAVQAFHYLVQAWKRKEDLIYL